MSSRSIQGGRYERHEVEISPRSEAGSGSRGFGFFGLGLITDRSQSA